MCANARGEFAGNRQCYILSPNEIITLQESTSSLTRIFEMEMLVVDKLFSAESRATAASDLGPENICEKLSLEITNASLAVVAEDKTSLAVTFVNNARNI